MKNNGQMDLIGGETSIGMNVIKPTTVERKAAVQIANDAIKKTEQQFNINLDKQIEESNKVKEESKNKTYILYRERNRFVYEMNEQKERNDFIVDSLKKRINSFTFLTVRKNDIPYKHTLIQDDNLRTE